MGRFADEWAATRTTRSTAEYQRRGVGRGTLRGAQYVRVARGYYRPATEQGAGITSTQRIVDAQATMPDGALIGGWAAAYVHGVDALDGLDHSTMRPLPVPVLLPPGLHRCDTERIHYRQSRRPIRGEVVHEVPVTRPVRTALDLACEASDLTEAVVALDAFLGARLLRPDHLQRGVERLGRRRGVRQARTAVDLARIGVLSTWETRLRVFAVLELGLAALHVNRAVFDRAGTLLGVPDLLDPEAALAMEYDGARWRSDRAAGHRNREQHREDNAREERLERAGLIVVRVEKSDLTTHRVKLAQRIVGAHQDGMARDRTRDRWTLEEPDDWYGLPA